MLLFLQNQWNDIREFFSEKGYDVARYPFQGDRGFFYEERDQTSTMNHSSINLFKNGS